MKLRYVLFCSIFFMVFFSSAAQAGNYVLTVQQLPNAEYEAVITYDTDVYCFVSVTTPDSIQIIGSEVLIKSPLNEQPVQCIEPVPPILTFEETANIGRLQPGVYTVSWTQPDAFSLSTSLTASGLAPASAIPSGSTWALVTLVSIMFVLAVPVIRSRRKMPK